MPRPNRIKNLFRLERGSSSLTMPSLEAHVPSLSPQAQAPYSSSGQAPVETEQPSQPAIPSLSSNGVSSQSTRRKRKAISETPRAWAVDIIDENQVVKMVKLKVKDVHNLDNGLRVIVEFDEVFQPIGKSTVLLAGVLGQLATNPLYFPIGFETWPSMPDSFFDRVVNEILMPRFLFRVDQQNLNRYLNYSISKKWRDYRLKLWDAVYNPLLTKDDYIRMAPESIPIDQWALFVNYRTKEKTIELCKRNRQIRQQQNCPHTCGAMSTARRRHIKKLAGEDTDRGKMWIETHKNKDGNYVNDEAREIGEKIEELRGQRQGPHEISPTDALGVIFGPEHPGRVRGLGSCVVPTMVFKQTSTRINRVSMGSSSSPPPDWQQQMTTMKSQLHALYSFIRMNAAGNMPEELANLFPTPPQAPDLGSGTSSPVVPRRSLDGSYDEEQGSED